MNRSYLPAYLPYMIVTTVYNLLFAGALLIGRRRQPTRPLPPVGLLDVALLSLATFRLGRLLSHDVVTRFLREPFVEVETVPGPGGVPTVQEVPEGHGLRRSIGELFTCSRCSSMWAAALLHYGLWLAPTVARPFVHLLAVAGLAEFFDLACEWLAQSSQWYYRQYTAYTPIPGERQAA